MTTDVVGGAGPYGNQARGFNMQDRAFVDNEARTIGWDQIAGIMRTVRVEQTYS